MTYAGTGKAVVYDDKGGRVSNCLIADNVVSEEMPENPRAIAIVKSVGLVDNCTIVANTTCGEQYQLFPTQDTGADGCAVNCLVAANETNGVACAYVPSTYRVVNCLTDGTTPIGVDGHVAELSDIFADAAAGDWHLRVGVRSPAVNRGRTDLGWGTACVPPVDLNGQARIEANKIDIGCYEGVFIPLGVILIFR